jgi:hypothetical protein
MLPPMTVYKSANGSFFTSWCEGGPPGATFAANKSGWFDMEQFNIWFKQVNALSQNRVGKIVEIVF